MSQLLKAIIRSFGVWGTTALMTLFVVASAVLVVAVSYLLVSGTVAVMSLQVAACTAALLAPLIGFGFVRLVQELDTAQTELREMMLIDPATRAYSWKHFQQLCQMEIERARRFERPVTPIYMRLTGVEKLSRLHGDEAVGKVRQAVVSQAKKVVRQFDLVGVNPNGDILLLLPEAPVDHGQITIERIEFVLQRSVVHLPDGDTHPSLSTGFATCSDDSHDWDSLVADAREALTDSA